MHLPTSSPSREVTRELLSEATANLRATFFLAEQEGFTSRQVQNTTKLSQRAVTALCTLWNVRLR
jgi:hypothetical protein